MQGVFYNRTWRNKNAKKYRGIMNKYLLSLLIIYLSYNYQGHAADIFKYISENNYLGIQQEIELDQRWSYKKNSKKETPLQAAIKIKDVKLINYLITFGAQVSKKDIILAMNFFFDIYQNDLNQKYTASSEVNSLFAESLIKATLRTPPVEDNLQIIARILDLFCDPQDLALVIKSLFDDRKLEQRHIHILARSYKQLFLQDKKLDHEAIKIIVSVFIDLKVEHSILLFITEAYKLHSYMPETRPHYTTDISTFVMGQDFTQAILNKSQSYFMLMTPAALVRYVFLENKDAHIIEAIEYLEKLTNFVSVSILVPPEIEDKEKKYIFWYSIYEKLLNEGDLSGAFAVANALASTPVQKAISAKLFTPIKLVSPEHNFSNYRNYLADFKHQFHTPVTAIHMKDLTLLKEYSLWKEGSPKHINIKTVQALIDFRSLIGNAYRKAQLRFYSPSEAMKKFFNDLPQTPQELWFLRFDSLDQRLIKSARRSTSWRFLSVGGRSPR
jgi:hypothetical protein